MKARVLVVDDEKSMRVSLREFLKDDNYEVAVAEDADEAMTKLKAGDFDVILTDIILPRITGVALLKSIRETSPYVQVILMTGEPTVETASEAVRSGAFDYLTKPIDKALLLKTVANAARLKSINDDRRRLTEENHQYRNNLEHLVEVRTTALRESEARYRAVVEDQTELICRSLPDTTITFVNQAYCRFFGKRSDEFIGQKFMSLIPEEDHSKVQKHFASLGQVIPVNSHEHQVIRSDGEVRWMRWTNHAILNDEGNVTEMQGTGRDITERKWAEEVALERQKQLDDLLANVSAIVLEGSATQIDFVGGRVQEILGYPVEDWYNDKDGAIGFWINHLHPDDADTVNNCIEAIQRCEDHSFEYRMIAADGRVVWFYDTVTVESKNGCPTKIRSVMFDITERKRTEEIVLNKQKQLDNLLANVDAIVMEGSPGQIDFVGGRVKKILGYPLEDWFIHQDGPFGFWTKCLHPDDTEVINICKEAIERCEDHSFEYRMIAADGRVVWFYDTITVESRNGHPTKTRSVMIDITERKEAEVEMLDRKARLSLVKDMAMEITSDMSIEEVVTNALKSIFKMFPDYRVSFGNRLGDNLYRCMVSVGSSSMRNIEGTEFDITDAPEFIKDLNKGEVITNDILKDERVFPLRSQFEELQVRAVINTPVIHAAGLKGVIWLDSDVPHRWSNHEIATLAEVSRYLAVALKNAQLTEERKKALAELKEESAELIEKNIALNQVLEHLEKDKQNYKEQISESIESLLLPIVKKLKKRDGNLSPKDISLFENSLDSIVGKEIDVFRKNLVKLSPRELDICELIRAGKSSKEISSVLNLSTLTVHKHRESIRSKLQLKNKSTNLSAYLRTREFLIGSTQSLRN